MSFLSISARERRTLGIAALILVPSLGFIYGVRPYLESLGAMQDQLVTERTALSRERALVTESARNPKQQREADEAVQRLIPLLFEGRDDVIASAELASYVTRTAEHSRVNLQQAATRPAIINADGVRRLRIEIRGESDLEGILSFLYALEAGDKLVRFDKLDITRTPGRRGDEMFETLTLAATVSGFALGDAPVAPRSAKAPVATSKGTP